MAAVIAFVGLVVQLGSYVVARGYYQQFDVEASELGITPVNAALKMSDTALLLLLVAVGVLVLVALVWQASAGRAEGVTKSVPPGGPTGLILLAAATVVVVGLVLYLRTEAVQSARGTIDEAASGSASVILADADYRAAPVTVKWLDNKKEPIAFIFYPSAARVRGGLLLGINNGLFYIYFPREKTLARAPLSDVVVESFLGDQLPPFPASPATPTPAPSGGR
ncbi:MAG: hypothetical protein L0I76_11120 [Pseudonocardia sp.]|nr:hypothetical protein [Pseudonocardia sp.]